MRYRFCDFGIGLGFRVWGLYYDYPRHYKGRLLGLRTFPPPPATPEPESVPKSVDGLRALGLPAASPLPRASTAENLYILKP